MITDWFVQFEPVASPTRRLFVFPHAGASVGPFRRWLGLVGDGTDLRAVQLPGSGGRVREPGFDRMSDLVDALVTEIEPLLDLPFAFLGHSLGALVAFETALAVRGRGPGACQHLVVASSRAPHIPLRGPKMHTLPDSAFFAKLEQSSMTPKALLANKELMEMFLPPLRQSAAVGENYVYAAGDKLDVPITGMRGSADADVTRDEVEAWRAVTSGPYRFREFPGGHFFVQEHAAAIVRLLWDMPTQERV